MQLRYTEECPAVLVSSSFADVIVNSFLQISGQLKSLQIVASLTAERDGEIRKAALNTLATGYKVLGW